MILYQPPKNRGWKPLRDKALKLLIVHRSAEERKRFEWEAFDPIPPPFPCPGKGGGSGGYIPRRALGGSTAGTAGQGCEAPPRSGGHALDRQPRLCYGWRGDTSGRASVDETGKMGGAASGHGVQRPIQKHRSDFSGSGVLRKVDSPLFLFTFVKGRYVCCCNNLGNQSARV